MTRQRITPRHAALLERDHTRRRVRPGHPNHRPPRRQPWHSLLRVTAMALLLVAVHAGGTVLAQATPAEKAAAEALFDRGLAAMRAGNYPEACEQLEQSQAMEPGIGTLLYLAECYAQLGRTASAWASFREAASAAAAQGQTQRAEAGRQRAEALAPSLSRLSVGVAAENAALPGIEVHYGGVALTQEVWGVPIPVDPGQHLVRASAPGYAPFELTATVPPDGALVEVDVPALVPQPALAASPAPADAAPPAASTAALAGSETTAAPAAPGGRVQRVAGVILAGAGVASLAVGTYFGLRAFAKNGDAEDAGCRVGSCPTEAGIDFTEDAQDAAAFSNVFVTVGLALSVTGAVLYLLAPNEEARAAASRLRWAAAWSPDGQSGGLGVQGAF